MHNINSQVMKSYNLMLLVRTVQQNAPISRTKLAEKTGLTAASVINVTNMLLKTGVLKEVGRANGAAHGRKAVVLDLNADVLYTVGLELNTQYIITGVCNFKGKFISSTKRMIDPCAGVEPILDAMTEAIEQSIRDAGVPRDKILGIGLALPGPLDSQRGIMVNPPNFPGWNNVPICEILERRLGYAACCDRDTNAAILGEHCYGAAAGFRTAYMINMFELGIGGGLCTGDKVLHGFRDGAGEIGHITVDPNGSRCSCGAYGCLETAVSGGSLVRQAKQMYKMNLGVPKIEAHDFEALTLQDVLTRSSEGDEVCLQVVQRAAAYVSVALGSVIALCSPEVIVLGGPMIAMSGQLSSLIRAHIHAKPYPLHCHDIKVVESQFGNLACAMGGVVLAMDAFLRQWLSAHLELPAANAACNKKQED